MVDAYRPVQAHEDKYDISELNTFAGPEPKVDSVVDLCGKYDLPGEHEKGTEAGNYSASTVRGEEKWGVSKPSREASRIPPAPKQFVEYKDRPQPVSKLNLGSSDGKKSKR